MRVTMYKHTVHNRTYHFNELKTLMAKATPFRSGDAFAGITADSYEERIAAQMCLADLPLKIFLNEVVIPYETDEITRLIIDTHNAENFEYIIAYTIGELRDWLLSDEADTKTLQQLQYAFTPEMLAAVSKIMRNQDLVLAAQKCEVVTQFRNTIGLKGRFSSRLQPNHPTDDVKGSSGALVFAPEFYQPSANGTMVYLNGNPDLQNVLDKVEAAGGSILVPKTEISPEYGYMGVFIDTEGNRIGLHSVPK